MRADKKEEQAEDRANREFHTPISQQRSIMSNMLLKQTVGDLTEADAIRQAKNGDAGAFEHLYNMHCRRVYSLCLRMIRNPVEAEDLTQQTFLQLFRKIGTFRGESGFSTWLHRVTVNVVLLHIRRRKSAGIVLEDLERYTPMAKVRANMVPVTRRCSPQSIG